MTSCRYIVGDLLGNEECDVIAHQANCFSTMGAGIAKLIADKFPGLAHKDRVDPRPPAMKLGSHTRILATRPAVYNLYGQFKPGANTDYLALEQALLSMMRDINQWCPSDTNPVIGVPYKIGCGIGGGDWNTVLSILHRVSAASGRTTYIYVLPEFQSEVIDGQ